MVFVIGHEPLHSCGRVASGKVGLCLAYVNTLLAEIGKNCLEPCHLLGTVEHVVIGSVTGRNPCSGSIAG